MSNIDTAALSIEVGESVGPVSGLLMRPPDARCLYVLAHGAGAGMRHRFMEAVAAGLSERGVATLRYQFPYTEVGGRRPDPPAVLQATVRSAVATARNVAPGLPLLAGGKSLGGRMTSSAAARGELPGVRGLVFLGFPLHAPNRPGIERAEHLDAVQRPMLFLQGTRDALADLTLMRTVCGRLGERATLHVLEGGDHSFAVLKRSGRDQEEVMAELADAIASWALAKGLL
jgi:predicted alpha/beta-hydrolase family hydrolase